VTPTAGELHTQAYFAKASAAYEEAMTAFSDSLEVVADAKSAVFEAKDRIRNIEDEVMVNGAAGIYRISAADTNKEKREAKIRLALRDMPEYVEARTAVLRAERELDRAEALRDTAANRMAIERRRCDAYLAAATQRAAVLQAQPPSRH
jgi:hypothetical protein